MSNYIKREDAENAIIGRCEESALWKLRHLSSVDVVEVVRCKDCKYWLPHTQFGFDEDNDEYHDYCSCHMPQDEFEAEYWDANDFCSYGEKKKNV